MDKSVSSVASTSVKDDVGRAMGSPELIEKMATAMRLRSGIDLPQAYFVEQVKLQLSGSPAFDASLAANDDTAPAKSDRRTDSFFRAWALRD